MADFTVKSWCAYLLKCGGFGPNQEAAPRVGEAGEVVHSCFLEAERYAVDFAPDFKSEGWEQFDTDQDAPYFGVWVNRRLFWVLTYAEGDWSLTECFDVERYNREIQALIMFYGEGKIATVIDRDGGVTTHHQDREQFLIATDGGAVGGSK